MPALLAVLSSITFGTSDFIGGLAAKRVPTLVVVVWSEVIGFVAVLLVAPLFGAFEITGTEVAWSTAAGAAGAIGFLFLFEGLSKGRMAVVSPAAAVTGAALPVFAGVLLGERPAPLAWAGILVALPAIWMVSAVGDDSSRRTAHLDYGLLAGVGFGLFFLFMAQTSEASGLWPLVVARGAALMVVAPLAVIRRIDLAWPREVTWQILLVGIGDIAANALFLLAVRSGLISLVAVLSSLYPVVTVLLARLISHEHLRTIQIAGVAMTVVAVAAISAA